jgi:hypothetical protein
VILIRGNHETCSRAGTGYFRYLHHGSETDCSDPYSNSPEGAATQPWIVDFQEFQVGITDTSTPPKGSTTQAFADQLNLLGHYFDENRKPALFGSRKLFIDFHHIFFGISTNIRFFLMSYLKTIHIMVGGQKMMISQASSAIAITFIVDGTDILIILYCR